jgi:hypothetical protein
MISIKNSIGLSVLCLAALLYACGGQQDGMLTLASQDVPYFYADRKSTRLNSSH